MEIEIQETVSHTCQESTHNPSVSKSHHRREVRNKLISPPKCHPVARAEIKERADKIRRKMFVTSEQKSRIEKQTRDQADCEAWYRHRKPRITASKCRRTFIKPTTSRTKAMKEIMGMDSTVSTSFMKMDNYQNMGSLIENIQKSKCCKSQNVDYFFLKSTPS